MAVPERLPGVAAVGLLAEGAAILICNHVSYVDGPIIDAGCKRSVRYIIDEAIYNLPGVHYLMKLDRAIPIAPHRKSVEAVP